MEVSNLARNIINLRFNMMLSTVLFMLVVVLSLMAGEASGKLQAQGKYEMLATPNKNTDERSIVDNMKMLFGGGSNRAPAHDTPASACSCRCGERNDASRIVGGQATGVNEFPWMARLSYFNRFYCGGMLINDRYVLTAAHCVKGFMWFMIKVTFGEHNRCDDSVRPETRFVLRAIAQKFSFLNFDNDIALLRLNDRVPITDFIRPICLPSDPSNAYVGTNGTATGWGTLKEDGKPSCILQEVEVPVLSNEVCSTQTNYTASMITDNMMCAGYLGVGEKDSCQGDSGGPLIAEREDKRYELIGVVSWGNGCARPYYPGVYTRVTRYLDWIRENSKDGCFCSE
ncbi:venom protease-like [Anopheles funestus]|uniref:venom protease-like n=1 Tax=Anopheles funestus TaxID=62324 RepID=UPI0020C5DD4D|nr:venom protease-like [Anopheles funestus]